MRKILLFMLFAYLSLPSSINAQNYQLGIKTGISKTILERIYDDVGWYIGPMLDLSLPLPGFSTDVSILYHQVHYAQWSKAFTDRYVEVPLNLKWNFYQKDLWNLYLAIGPQFTYQSDGSYNNNWALSFNVGAGVKLMKHFQLGLNYNMPLGRTVEIWLDGGSPISSKRKGLWMTLAYLF